MAGVIVFDPDDEDVGLSTGDTVALNTYLDILSDTLFYTDGENIFEWEGDENGLRQTYTWKSGEIRMPYPVNMGAALVEAEAYTEVAVTAVIGDDYWEDTLGNPVTVFATNFENGHTGPGSTTDTEDARSVVGTMSNGADITGSFSQLNSYSINLRNSDAASTGYAQYGSVQADYDAYQLDATEDFTIDGFIWIDNIPPLEGTYTILNSVTTGAINFEVAVIRPGSISELEMSIGQFWYYEVTCNGIGANPSLGTDTWHYFLIQYRYNNGSPELDFYGPVDAEVNTETQKAPITIATTVPSPETVNGPLTVGAGPRRSDGVIGDYFDGFIDGLRLTKAARYPTTPSVIPIPDTWYTAQSVTGVTYDITFRLYADGVLKHTQTVADDEPFRLPGGYLSNIYSVEIESQMPVTRVSVAENVFELAEG